jgi:SAM-dependent methyltransferase
MSSDDGRRLLTDRRYLTRFQYRDDANLAARQSVYAFRQPRIDLAATVLDLAGLAGSETIVDVGCGNGPYLAELTRRGHAGRLAGADLSPGMLAITRTVAAGAAVTIADAQALPFADAVADVTLAPHMLYHVPDRSLAAAEFRRITRPGGQLLVVLNGPDHVRELGELATEAACALGLPPGGIRAEYQAYGAMTLDAGAKLLSGIFSSGRGPHFRALLTLCSPEPVAAYLASMRFTQAMPDPAALTAAAVARIPFGPDGKFRVTSHSGVLICR